jgi:hypothetical protein
LPAIDEITGTRFPVPIKPTVKVVAVAPDSSAVAAPSINVLIVPAEDKAGAIESICFEVAIKNNPGVEQCIQDFLKCTGAIGWPPQKLAKARMRAFFAGTHKRNPDIGLHRLWEQSDDAKLVPLSDHLFEDLVSKLRNILS